jgi:L-aminopeptidase/D-esterase-like protein
VGHYTRTDDGWLTGTTVVRLPVDGAVAGVDVAAAEARAPARPTCSTRATSSNASMPSVLSGGSAFGLAAADGVMSALLDRRRRLPHGGPGEVVPIVPGAVIFDLGRGRSLRNRPDASFGARAYAAAMPMQPVAQGCVGAGTGAKAGGIKGGIGSASTVLPTARRSRHSWSSTPSAPASTPAPGTCMPSASASPASFPSWAGPIDPERLAQARARRRRGGRPAQARPRHDDRGHRHRRHTDQGPVRQGLGHRPRRAGPAIRPVHTMFDGDTLFTVATGARGADGCTRPLRLPRPAGCSG